MFSFFVSFIDFCISYVFMLLFICFFYLYFYVSVRLYLFLFLSLFFMLLFVCFFYVFFCSFSSFFPQIPSSVTVPLFEDRLTLTFLQKYFFLSNKNDSLIYVFTNMGSLSFLLCKRKACRMKKHFFYLCPLHPIQDTNCSI